MKKEGVVRNSRNQYYLEIVLFNCELQKSEPVNPTIVILQKRDRLSVKRYD